MSKYKKGYYFLTSEEEPVPLLAKFYKNPGALLQIDEHIIDGKDYSGFGFGFNVSDGGGFLHESDLRSGTVVTPVTIVSKNDIDKANSIIATQCSSGSWDLDHYMHGLANGMLLTKAVILGGEYEPLDAPSKWGCDSKVKRANISVSSGGQHE